MHQEKFGLATVQAAKQHSQAVIMDGQHQKPAGQGGCTFCKCPDCKKMWDDPNILPKDYRKVDTCPYYASWQSNKAKKK